MELEIKVGRGFCPGDENKKPDQAIGVIAIDSLFSPVTRVRYAVENARVGQRTDYDGSSSNYGLMAASRPTTRSPRPRPFCSIIWTSLSAMTRTPWNLRKRNQAGRRKVQAQETSQHERERNRVERARGQLPEQRQHHHSGPIVHEDRSRNAQVSEFRKKSLTKSKKKLASLSLSLGMNIDPALLDTPKEETKLAE